MTDRELLEAAAKAEGHTYPWVMAGGHMDHAEMVDGEGSRAAATRRAITRAAALSGGDAP